MRPTSTDLGDFDGPIFFGAIARIFHTVFDGPFFPSNLTYTVQTGGSAHNQKVQKRRDILRLTRTNTKGC